MSPRLSSSPGRPPRLHIVAEPLVRVLIVLIPTLLVCSYGGRILVYYLGWSDPLGIAELFDVDREANLPTYVSGMLLAAAAVLLGVLARVERDSNRRAARLWRGLALVFAWISLDEVARIHEKASALRDVFAIESGIFYFAWVLPAMGILALLAAVYTRFVFNLPPATRTRFLLAAGLYVGGALGMEMVSAWYVSTVGDGMLRYGALVTLEEGLEMAGVAVFVVALVRHLAAVSPKMEVHFGRGEARPAENGRAVSRDVTVSVPTPVAES